MGGAMVPMGPWGSLPNAILDLCSLNPHVALLSLPSDKVKIGPLLRKVQMINLRPKGANSIGLQIIKVRE
jgi:hypothetical protein